MALGIRRVPIRPDSSAVRVPRMIREPTVIQHTGKSATQEHLASRHAMSSITGGDPVNRMTNNYRKAGATPPGDAAGLDPFGGSFQGGSDYGTRGIL